MAATKRAPRTKTATTKTKMKTGALLTPAQAAHELREYGWISLWVGQFANEERLDTYIDDEEFERDIGYVIDRAMPPFRSFADAPGMLFESWGFNGALKKRLEGALAALDVRANAAILEGDYRWDPARVRRRARPKVHFLGSFRKD